MLKHNLLCGFLEELGGDAEFLGLGEILGGLGLVALLAVGK